MFGSALDIERPFGDDVRMARTRVRRRRLAAVLLLAVLVGVLTGPVADAMGVGGGGGGGGSSDPRTYVVRPGDTLWAIARRAEPSVDPRIVVDAIAAANDVDAGALVPGQQLAVPAFG
jgi:nucleoid-associated protein YgaU